MQSLQTRQSSKDVILALLICVGFLWDQHNLTSYLSELHQSVFLLCGFWMTLALSAYHEVQPGYKRITLVRFGAITMIFAIGVIFAQLVREQYVAFASDITNIPDIAKILGTDMVGILSNRVVGYSGCFGIGVMLTRLVLHKTIVRIFTDTVINQDNLPCACPLCGTAGYKP